MNSAPPGRPPARGAGPALQILAAFPIACFTCAMLTDLAYVRTAEMIWANFSSWLLAIGMAGGVLAALAAAVVMLVRRRAGWPVPWPAVLGSLLVLVLAFFNNLVHSRDAWTSVMPTGLALSIATVLVMLVTVWIASAAPQRDAAMSPAGVRR